jgi:hypothetical protein
VAVNGTGWPGSRESLELGEAGCSHSFLSIPPAEGPGGDAGRGEARLSITEGDKVPFCSDLA